MKKFSFLCSVLSLLAMTALLSSCRNGHDDPVNPPATVTNMTAEEYAVVASSNVEATFSINVIADEELSADKKGALFTNIAKGTKAVKIMAIADGDGFVNKVQTATINFSDKSTSAAIAFTFAKKSTDTKTQDEVKNATADVTVSSDQTAGSEANAVMTIPQGVVISGNVNPNEAFSVTAYEPAPEIVSADQVKVGQPLASDQPVMILGCTPNGAQFDKPVKLTVNVGTALAGQTLTIENNGEKVSSVVKIDGSVDFMVTHFSEWDLLFAPVASKIEPGTKNLLSMSSFEIAKGTNTFSYIKNVGCQFNASGLIMDFIKSKFGETYTTVDETGSFESDGPGTGTLKVDQSYTTYTLVYGTMSFTATVWGNVVATAQPNGGDAHSGGSGN